MGQPWAARPAGRQGATPPNQPWTVPALADLGQWRRTHPLSPLVRVGPGILFLAVLALLSLVNATHRSDVLIRLGVVVLILVLGFVSWLVTRWRVGDGMLQIETGLIRRQSLRFPLPQIQAVDIVRPGLARLFNLAELRVRMASGGRSTGRLAYLPDGQAEALRTELLQLARARVASPIAAEPAAAFSPLYTVNRRRLVASILLDGPALFVYAIVAALAVVAAVSPRAAAGALGGLSSILVAMVAANWARFNGLYRMSLGVGPDGLHVRTGLVQTMAETIPWSRIQALRSVQPVLWRPFGWRRIEVDVAGRNVSGRRDRSAKRAGRALIPVGREDEARWLLDLVMPGAPTALVPPPRRVRWKSPLRYPQLSFATNDRYAVTTSGRFRRVTDWVPLAKVQSLRWSSGPLQRRLRVRSIYIDTAGRSVFAVARDRDEDEAEALFAALPGACRRARTLG